MSSSDMRAKAMSDLAASRIGALPAARAGRALRVGWALCGVRRGSTVTLTHAALAAALAFVSLLLVTVPCPARAVVIGRSLAFSASGFTATDGSTPPIATLGATVTLIWDTDVSVTDSTAGIMLVSSSNLPLGSAIAFNYDSGSDLLTIGGLNAGVSGLAANTDDFRVYFASASSTAPTPTGIGLSYATLGTTARYTAVPLNVTVTSTSIDIPEPGTLALSVLPLLGLAAAHRPRRDRTPTA